MASGDTKTEQMLNVLGNGGDASQFRGCCNTKTQNYILDAIDRMDSIETEVEDLKNNPDVVDIVATYQDLLDYDTSTLTNNDIIRVLSDSTHNNKSSFYRYNADTQSFVFIGAIDNYVTNTDYATSSIGGVVRVTSDSGIQISSGGIIRTQRATDSEIDAKTSAYKPIVPANLDYAVASIVGHHETMTQAQYDAIATKDPNTYYYIIEE